MSTPAPRPVPVSHSCLAPGATYLRFVSVTGKSAARRFIMPVRATSTPTVQLRPEQDHGDGHQGGVAEGEGEAHQVTFFRAPPSRSNSRYLACSARSRVVIGVYVARSTALPATSGEPSAGRMAWKGATVRGSGAFFHWWSYGPLAAAAADTGPVTGNGPPPARMGSVLVMPPGPALMSLVPWKR